MPEDLIRGGSVSAEDIVKAELIYRNAGEEFYQPYYKFYVELKRTEYMVSVGLKQFGVFYVPAVEAGYLEDFEPVISSCG